MNGPGLKALSFPLVALLALTGCREAAEPPDPAAVPRPEAPAIAAPSPPPPAPLAEAAALNERALAEQEAGDLALARVHFRRALRILAPWEPAAAAEAALYRENLARLMIIEGEREEAARLLRPLRGQAAPSPSGLAEVAWLQLLDDRPEEALATLDAALGKVREETAPGVLLEIVLHDRRGTALERLGRPAEARAAYLLALELARGHAPASTAAATRVNLCRLAALDPRPPPPAGGETCAKAVAAAGRCGVPAATLASALFWQALELQRRDRLDQAYRAARDAARRVAELRSQASSPERRARFLEERGLYVSLAVELAMEIHRRRPGRALNRDALADSELWRARALADEAEGLRRGDPLLLELREARRRQRGAPAADDELEERTAVLETRWRSGRPGGKAAELFDLGALQRLLDAETTVFVLMLGDRRSYLWRVGARELASFELPAGPEIEGLAGLYLGLIANPTLTSRRASALEAGKALAEALFGADLARLGGSGRRLVFVGDGGLAAFPLGALPTPPSTPELPTFLVEQKEIVTLPSLRLLSVLHQPRAPERRPSGGLALVGDPWYGLLPWQKILQLDPVPAAEVRRLTGADPPFAVGRMPFAGSEMDLVAAHWAGRPSSVFRAQGPAATRELAISEALDDSSVIHFSAHGELEPGRPENSAIVLSELDDEGRRRPGRLTPEDLAGLGWRAELVVASSCESGSGQPFRFEGLGGLARGFFYAGASRSLASLWKVEDRATAALMDRFYAALTERRLGPGEALRAAQHALLSDARAMGRAWRAPYYWSGFALSGDWRAFSPPSR